MDRIIILLILVCEGITREKIRIINKKRFNMLYIGFSKKSHKLSAKILCKKYRHCAPVLITKEKCIIYQFVSYKKIVPIYIRPYDINTLKHFGWIFIKYNTKFDHRRVLNSKAFTCVQFTKHVLNIKNIMIQTPDALLKYLSVK